MLSDKAMLMRGGGGGMKASTASGTASGGGGTSISQRLVQAGAVIMILATLWASGGVIMILGKSIKRILPIALEPFLWLSFILFPILLCILLSDKQFTFDLRIQWKSNKRRNWWDQGE
jgi:hypothetical protein